ncbi:hypothetical protein [Nocardioides sp. URHA0032]|uniref:hypothetical protein n=1 Tax=Nocardioides sp. URHA0032 TaxID=1380388 RepID=UPI000491F5C2|nr:hypothetical protein [Nocardioides sp. URHA0032]
MHPEDAGVYHHSPTVDAWHPLIGDNPHDESINVRVEGFRHDNGDDWADEIYAENICPGFLAEVGLQVPDARRLGEALLMACDLAEGIAR